MFTGVRGETKKKYRKKLCLRSDNSEKLCNFDVTSKFLDMKPSREAIINEILSEMDFGISYTECKATIGEKRQVPDRTFDRYWKEAGIRYLAANERDKQVVAEVREQAVRLRALGTILTKEERMQILTDIATGGIPLVKHIVCDGVIQEREVVPSWRDRRDAVAELNKMEGAYAPVRKDITTNGDSIAPAPVFRILLDDDGEL